MTIDSSIRDKVIELHKKGKKRDAIAHDLNLTGIKISTGSVSNILKEWRQRESERSEVPNIREQPKSTDRVATFPDEGLAEIEFKKNPDISIEDHKIVKTQDFEFEKNGYAVDQGWSKGAPLNWFTNGYNSETKSEDSEPQHQHQDQHQPETSVLTDLPPDKSLLQSSPSTFVKTIVAAQPQQQQRELVADIQDLLEPEDLSLDKVEPEAIQEMRTPRGAEVVEKPIKSEAPVVDEKLEPIPKTESGRTVPRTRPRFVEDKIERELSTYGRRAWDYYGAAQTAILNQINKEKYQRTHERLVLDRREKKLEEWEKRLEQKESNLKDKESSLRNIVTEAEPFLAVVKELEKLGIGINEVIPWIETIREKAKVEKIDQKKAAAQIAQELGFYIQCGGIKRQIDIHRQELGLMEMATIQKQQVITVLTNLLNKGVTESQILQLINWNKYSLGNGNLQQSGNNNPGPGNFQQPNNQGPSMNDWIRLNLLKSNTTRQLNRMGM